MIDSQTIQQAKDTNLVELIGRYTALKRHGSQYRGLCPFHDERTPSFYVSQQRGYKCFACDVSGANAVDFIMAKEGKDFKEAVELLTGSISNIQPVMRVKAAPPAPQVYIPADVLDSLPPGPVSNLARWMADSSRGEFAFDRAAMKAIRNAYRLRTWANLPGWVLFPCIDIRGRITAVKAMNYNPATGKRIKEPQSQCKYIEKELLNDYYANTKRCFFGEHLMTGNSKTIKIFESEATAIYASVFYPDSVCLATGGKMGFAITGEKSVRVLEGRSVTLYPDLDAHAEWKEIAAQMVAKGINATVSQLLYDKAAEYAWSKGISMPEMLTTKFDLRDVLMYKTLPGISATLAPAFKRMEQYYISGDLAAIDRELTKLIDGGINTFQTHILKENAPNFFDYAKDVL